MNAAFDNEIRLKLLKLIEKKPELTQREMSRRMGVSLGKVNYCISAFVDKGRIKIERFKNNENKTAYMYRLTPKGFEDLTKLTFTFLKIKLDEYKVIKQEIQSLSDQIDQMDLSQCEDPELLEALRNLD